MTLPFVLHLVRASDQGKHLTVTLELLPQPASCKSLTVDTGAGMSYGSVSRGRLPKSEGLLWDRREGSGMGKTLSLRRSFAWSQRVPW